MFTDQWRKNMSCQSFELLDKIMLMYVDESTFSFFFFYKDASKHLQVKFRPLAANVTSNDVMKMKWAPCGNELFLTSDCDEKENVLQHDMAENVLFKSWLLHIWSTDWFWRETANVFHTLLLFF